MSTIETPTFTLEHTLAGDGYSIIVGFDEVGRGSLAGPVMVGAAAFLASNLRIAAQTMPQDVADSKLLTEHKREALFEPLQQWVDAYAIGAASNAEIDEWGISHALGIAALRALDQVERDLFGNFMQLASEQTASNNKHNNENIMELWGEPTEHSLPRVGAILDGPHDYITKALGSFEAPEIPVPAHVITQVKGDRRCGSVAAAAVLAKVTRDRLMVEYAQQDKYAPYGWEHNKGYGSKAHKEAIAKYGPSDLHRVSWKLE